MDETKYDIIIGINKFLAYVFSGSTLFLSFLNENLSHFLLFLNDYVSQYGAALSFLGWALTFLLNWYYQQKRLIAIELNKQTNG